MTLKAWRLSLSSKCTLSHHKPYYYKLKEENRRLYHQVAERDDSEADSDSEDEEVV